MQQGEPGKMYGITNTHRLGAAIRTIRKERRIAQTDLASAAGSPTEGIVAYFDTDTATDDPDDVIGTGIVKHDELEDATRDTMASH